MHCTDKSIRIRFDKVLASKSSYICVLYALAWLRDIQPVRGVTPRCHSEESLRSANPQRHILPSGKGALAEGANNTYTTSFFSWYCWPLAFVEEKLVEKKISRNDSLDYAPLYGQHSGRAKVAQINDTYI